MDSMQIVRRSAVDLAESMRSGALDPRVVMDVHIRRCTQLNGRLNALVRDRFDAARVEAQAAYDEIRTTDPDTLRQSRPLLGVPFTVKEMIAVRGMPLAYGSRSRADRRAEADATVVARLRAAGAIPIGISNVPEWGMWSETYNDLYGRTRNPHDLRRTPGGSSGGEGALVGAGCSVFGVGSDIGGSIRMPAAFCGVYAHKPGSGVLPLGGHYPVMPDRSRSERRTPYLAIGALARSAADLMPLLRAMQATDELDPNLEAVQLGDPAAVAWAGRRVVLLPAPRIRRVRRTEPALQQAVREAGRVLERRGATVTDAPADLLRDAGDAWFSALQSVGGPGFAEVLGGGERIALGRELLATAAGRGRYSWPALFFCIGERIGRKRAGALERALDSGRRLERRFQDLLGDDGVLIAPVHPRVAPRHNEPVLFAFDFLLTAAFNALRVPVSVAPMGFDGRGLPLAVQCAAARGGDHLTIAAVLALEAAQQPWTPAVVPTSQDVLHS